jgi:hypothetical protein
MSEAGRVGGRVGVRGDGSLVEEESLEDGCLKERERREWDEI